MLEFLAYIKNSTEEVANHSNSQLVQEINKRVKLIKEDKRTEVEYMTLLERDEKNREEARKDVARKLIKKGLDDVFIVEITDLTLQQVKELRNEL
ncbi:MAG: hypothetical protein II005_02925 [Turicibacter sp.]|nr:hypothetical protein [Turicibacter sp.]